MDHFLAVDLGAESGRVMLASVEVGRLTIEELHRFPNGGVSLPSGLYWDVLRLYQEILEGLRIAGRDRKIRVRAIGIDTWGVDFAFLGHDGSLIGNPHHYRDPRNQGMLERMLAAVPKQEVFDATGIQFMTINSLCQWYAAKLANDPVLETARTLLFIPDLFNYWLSGEVRAEVTIASTSQFYDPRARNWASGLLNRLGLDSALLPPLVEPGSALGPLRAEVAEYTGLKDAVVYASAGHDTAAAVAAVPASDDDWCYISSGSWSLMGVEIPEPLITPDVMKHNFTNEAGVGGATRLLKNIAGLWLLQECRRHWALEGQTFSYDDLTRMAETARPYEGYIPPDEFSQPGNMPEQIASYCRRSGQPVPKGHAETTRAILQGLARRYAEVLDILESLTGRHIQTIHVVGGGSRNGLLNHLLADRTGRRVMAGPVETTAIGNVLVQMIGAGLLRELAQGRALVRSSFDCIEFVPGLAAGRQQA